MAETSTTDAVSRLSWALRRYLGLVVGLTLLTAVAVTIVAPPPPADEYEASALVVAQELEGVRAEHLPRMAEAIFSGNNVARQTVAETGLEVRPQELVPDHVRIEVVEATVVMRVVGISEDPSLAADLANEAAEALVGELGRLGPGVGTFALQEPAPVPEDPAPQPLRIPPLLLGLLGGAVLGVGTAGLLLVLRRPVIDVDAATRLADAPLLSVLELSRAGHFDDPEDVAGIVPLVDELYPRRHEIQIVETAWNSYTRSQVAVLLTRALATCGPVLVAAAKDRAGRRAARFLRAISAVRPLIDTGNGDHQYQLGESLDPIPVVVDGRPSTRLTVPAWVQPVLVVPEGVSEERLRRAVNHLRPHHVYGVVWVASKGGAIRGIWRRLFAPPPREPVDAPIAPTDPLAGSTLTHGPMATPAGDEPRQSRGQDESDAPTPADDAGRRAGP